MQDTVNGQEHFCISFRWNLSYTISKHSHYRISIQHLLKLRCTSELTFRCSFHCVHSCDLLILSAGTLSLHLIDCVYVKCGPLVTAAFCNANSLPRTLNEHYYKLPNRAKKLIMCFTVKRVLSVKNP